MTSEIWKPVVGYEGQYEVSSKGQVRRLKEFKLVDPDKGLYAPARFKILASYVGPNGYVQARLSKGARAETVSVHRLVCAAFHGAAPDGQNHVAHWDGNKCNNNAENLRWASPKENAEDRNRHGTGPVGEKAPNGKLTGEDVLKIRSLYTGGHGELKELGKAFGVTSSQIFNIVKRKQWAHI